MKTTKLLIALVLLAGVVKAQQKANEPVPTPMVAAANVKLPSDDFYEHFVLKHDETAAPEGYGLKPDMLIPVGAYEEDLTNQAKISKQLNRFFHTLVWPDGSALVYVSRNSSLINTVNVEQFKVTKSGGKDTVTLFVDMYKSGPVMAPKGFKFYAKDTLAKGFKPVLEEIDKYYAYKDRFKDTAAVAVSLQILGVVQSAVGIDYMLDHDVLDPLVNDTGLDLDLKAFLIRSYLFRKLYYQVTGQDDAKTKAFNGIVDDYQWVIKDHDVFAKGGLANYMVKK